LVNNASFTRFVEVSDTRTFLRIEQQSSCLRRPFGQRIDCHKSRRISPDDLSSDRSAGVPSFQTASNVIVVLTLLTASAALGLAAGLVFRVWINALLSPLIAIASAIFLHGHGVGFGSGVLVTIGCIAVSQIAYVVGTAVTSLSDRAKNLTQEEIDGDPGSRGEQDVHGEDK
jgi:hypothetical protein